jgi:hypothetical protein
MAIEFNFASPSEKPALIGLTTAQLIAVTRACLTELGFKVHDAANHEDFITRFTQIPYQVVVLEEMFACDKPEQNLSLGTLQHMLMNQRRQAVTILVGESYETMNSLQSFQQSVHAVVNSADIEGLSGIISVVLSEHGYFLNTWREAQNRLLQARV